MWQWCSVMDKLTFQISSDLVPENNAYKIYFLSFPLCPSPALLFSHWHFFSVVYTKTVVLSLVFFSHILHPIHQGIFVVLSSKYIQYLSVCCLFVCFATSVTRVWATISSPLYYCISLPSVFLLPPFHPRFCSLK